jgi:hypothetical protein
MGKFPAALAALVIVGGSIMIGIVGFGLGKEDLRGRYHLCIELGAPQQNCIDEFLGKRK